MAKTTKIEWCDSTVNPMMGCDGCELWSPRSGGTCYAAELVKRFGGKNKGLPVDFDEPEIWPLRILEACRWPDMTGTGRPDKPWLNGRPRHVFVGDMGDVFTETLQPPAFWDSMFEIYAHDERYSQEEFELVANCEEAVKKGHTWLAPFVDAMAEAPHVWQILTKRPRQFQALFRDREVPSNFVLMTSVTSSANVSRIHDLLAIESARCFGVSYEPILGPVDFEPYEDCLHWLILGGESGRQARTNSVAHVRSAMRAVRVGGGRVFVKQLGARCAMSFSDSITAADLGCRIEPDSRGRQIVHLPGKGGDWHYWPVDLRRREMPEVRHAA